MRRLNRALLNSDHLVNLIHHNTEFLVSDIKYKKVLKLVLLTLRHLDIKKEAEIKNRNNLAT